MNSILDRDDLLPLSVAARRLPGRPHRATLFRWSSDGCLAPDGTRIFLETVKVGRKIFVAPRALDEFVSRLSTPPIKKPTNTACPQARPSSHRADVADQEAEKLGI